MAIVRLHIVAIGALASLTFGWVLLGAHLWISPLFAAVDWFLVNLLNRVVDVEEDSGNKISGVKWIVRHATAVLRFGLVILIASFALNIWLSIPLLIPRICFHLLGFAYNWRILPGKRRLKETYFFKNLASATGFQLTVFAYPLSLYGFSLAAAPPDIGWRTLAWSILFLLTFVLSYEVIYDLRDLEGDRRSGAQTYPVVHGPRAAIVLVYGFLAAAIALITIGYAIGDLPWRVFVMICAPIIQATLFTFALLGKRALPTPTFCTRLTWLGAALLGCYNVWIVFKLPWLDQ